MPESPSARARGRVSWWRFVALTLGVGALLGTASLSAQAPGAAPAQSQTRRVSVTWRGAPIAEVLRAFAAFSGASIVAGAGVTGSVTADINDQPWDVALASILSTHGLVATENASGIIRVENMGDVGSRETIEPIVTRSYRISFTPASEIQTAIAPLLTSRGGISVIASSNTVIVSDIAVCTARSPVCFARARKPASFSRPGLNAAGRSRNVGQVGRSRPFLAPHRRDRV